MTLDARSIERCASFASEPVEIGGSVRVSTRLPVLRVPYVVTERLLIAARPDGAEAIVTIPPFTTVAFRQGTDLTIGSYGAGKLVAETALFTSADAAPQPGSWGGILIGDHGSADLNRVTFEYGGMSNRPLIAFSADARRKIEIRNSHFRRKAGPAVADPVACDKWRRADRRNLFEDRPSCVRDRR